MEENRDEVLLQTLELLEWRLRRLEFVLNGDISKGDAQNQPTVSARIQRIESSIRHLASKSRVIAEILQFQARFPTLFDAPRNIEPEAEEPSSAEKLAMVLTEAPSFHATSSQLTSLNDLPVPPAESFTSLVALQPRINEVEQQQVRQAEQISELRQRSGVLILRWHEISILGQGRCWAEWDSRLRKAERSVRKEEVRVFQEEEEV